MSGLVIVERYRSITGDNVSGDIEVSAKIEDAIDRLEEDLERPLRFAERAEPMYPGSDRRVYPHAVPIMVADGYTIDGYSLLGTWPWPWFDITTDSRAAPVITYSGGWVERSANPGAINRLPSHFEEDIAFAAYGLLHPSPAGASSIPQGAVSVSLGDASVSFGPGGAPSPGRRGITWSRATMRYRYQRLGGS